MTQAIKAIETQYKGYRYFSGGMFVEVKPKGGDFTKAMIFAEVGKHQMWLAEDTPAEAWYKASFYESFEDGEAFWWDSCYPLYYKAQYENRMFWVNYYSWPPHDKSLMQGLMPGDPLRTSEPHIVNAVNAARSARFEHGETPR